MSLRIVSGTAKGQKLKAPKKFSIRPASARLRKSVFEILGDLSGKVALDLFAGTGAMGLEGLSRGAEHVTFVDADPHAIHLLFKNLEQTHFLSQAYILKRTVVSAITFLAKKRRQFDLIFLDPPYDRGHIEVCLKKLNDYELLKPGGQLVSEHSPRELPKFLGRLQKMDERKYGQTIVSILRNPSCVER